MTALRLLWLRLTRRLPTFDAAWFRTQADQAERERKDLRDEMAREGAPSYPARHGTGDDVLKGIAACERLFRRVADLMERHGLDVEAAVTQALAEED